VKKKSLILVALAALAISAFAVPAMAGGAKKSIKIGDNYFVKSGKPSTVSIKKNTTVTFKWTGHAPHDVFVTKGPKKFRSGNAKVKGSYKVKLTKKGTYKIICTIHAPDMALTIKVK
jgi:plastocyanin